MAVLFCAELNELKTVHSVLKAINFKEYATIRIMDEGLKITIEEMKSVQTSAYIPQEVFTSFRVLSSPGGGVEASHEFKISIKVFTELLNIFGDEGGNHSLKLVYKEVGAPLSLVLFHNEDDITVDCEIKTMETEELAELSLQDECCLNNIVVNAAQFVGLLSELDTTAEVFELLTSDVAPFFKMSTMGAQATCQIEIPKTSEMIIIYRCTTTTLNKYIFSYIKQLIKVITLAEKVSLSTGEQGLLGLQLIIKTEGEKQMFVEYYVNALLD